MKQTNKKLKNQVKKQTNIQTYITMANSSTFLLLISLISTLFIDSQADLIGDICSKSANPSFCDKILRSDPRARGSDLKTLGKIAVGKASSATGDAIKAVKSSSNKSNKEIVSTCVETFNSAIDNLKEAGKLLSFGGGVRKADLQAKASAALTDITTCDDEFGGSEPPPVAQSSKNAQDSVSVLLAIVNRL